MAGRRGGAPGGVIRTYARLRPLRRVEDQQWFSPADRKRFFSSSSSSHLDSSCDPSSSEDPDFIPDKRKVSAPCRAVKLRPERRTFSKKKKKSLEKSRRRREKSSSNSDEKENDQRLLPPSDIVFSTPFRRYVTLRRKVPDSRVPMKPVSGPPRREVRPLLSPDSQDFEADHLVRRRRRRMCPDVDDLLSSSVEVLPSPLQKPPLLSSTPSVTLTAMPRTGDAFVRQLALCEPLEDSLVVCGADPDSSSAVIECDIPSNVCTEEKRMVAPSGGITQGHHTPRASPAEKERSVPGSGVKRLIISGDRSAVRLLSPLMVSSEESRSVVFIAEGNVKSALAERGDVFGASAELFSGDFTVNGEETTEVQPQNRVTEDLPQFLTKRAENVGGTPCCFRRETPNNWQDFSSKDFQPFVRLNSRIVREYLQKNKDRIPEHPEPSAAAPASASAPAPSIAPAAAPTNAASYAPSSATAPPMVRCPMQPVVSLDSAAVSKYFLKKDPSPEEQENGGPLPCNERSVVLALSCCSPSFQSITKTPQIASSVLKTTMQKSVAPPTIGTGRKVCISGFSAKRWGTLKKKTSSKTQQQLSFQDRSREDLGDTHSSSLLFSSSLLTSSFMNSTAVMNLNLSAESLTGRDPQREHQRWARLRAALTLHRRKKVEAGSPSMCPGVRRTRGKMSLSAQNSSLLLLSPFQSSLCTHELTDAEKVFAECQQDGPVPFHGCLTEDQLRCCQKVGEGVYGEVFRTLRGGHHVALKVIPIEGAQKVNGEHQKSFAEILPEIIISKELSLLSEGEDNQTSGFIHLHSAHCVQGSYPSELLSAWDTFAEEKGTENERPDLFGPDQLFMILEFEFGGEDLEQMSSKLPSVTASRSILHQVTAALAVAEEELRFEHRDLHWGNLLIEKSPSYTMSMSLCGETFDIPNAGIQVKIIDYTLSRLDKDGLTVFCDLSTDEELFQGEGDLQFDVYRRMRQENENAWSAYRPHSNVLWLHYLCDKLLSDVKYVKKPTTAAQRRDLRRLQDFRREVQHYGSATEVLKRSRLFK